MKGIVACPSPRSAEAGARTLRNGGNAVDAAVVTAAVQFLMEPQMCGVGGMGTLHVSLSEKGLARLGKRPDAPSFSGVPGLDTVLDFYGRAGEKAHAGLWEDEIERVSADTYVIAGHKNLFGYSSITTPGTVLGLSEALAKFGTLSWADALAPAISWADRGVVVDPYMYEAWAGKPVDPGFPRGRTVLKASPASSAIYFKPEGELHDVGETLSNPDYAATLRTLASKGPRELYEGELAARIAADFDSNGALITANDLRGYKTRPDAPVTGSYRGFTITTGRPPGCGPHLIELLNILESYDLASMEHNSGHYIAVWTNALRAIHSDRILYCGDPDFADVPVEWLASKERAAEWRAKIDRGESIRVPKPSPAGGVSTTQVTVVDEDGSAVSLTHTLGNYSGVVTPGLGFMYNNAMVLFHYQQGLPNSVAPGKARVTGMVPTMLYKDGELVMSIGSPGGFALLSAVAQTIVNIVDFGMTPVEAVSAARMHCEGGLVRLEGRIEESAEDYLRSLGNPILRMPGGYSRGIGLSHVVTRDPATGKLDGAADPRGNGGIGISRS